MNIGIYNLKSKTPNLQSKIFILKYLRQARKVQKHKVDCEHFTYKAVWWENLISLNVLWNGLVTPLGDMIG